MCGWIRARLGRDGVRRSPLALSLLAAGLAICIAGVARGAALRLKDGRHIEGKLGKVAGLAENPMSPNANHVPTITFVDDSLRRVFVPTFRILQVEEEVGEVKEKIGLDQRVARSGAAIHRLGPITKVTPFDDHGHRTLTMLGEKGPLNIVQGITQITPIWTKVEGLMTAGRTPFIWDMRIATSSIPRDTLAAILRYRIEPKNLEQRLKVVRLFLQADRYEDAQKVLEGVIADFPNEKQLAEEVQALRQLHAKSIVKEIEVRRQSGQHALAYSLLEAFPNPGVSGDVLQQVKDMLDTYRDTQKRLVAMHESLTSQIGSIEDKLWREQAQAVFEEMTREASINTLDRLAAYERLADDQSMKNEQKVALAISGWLLGSEQADTNLPIALSQAKIRALVERYLREPVKLERTHLFDQLRGQEGASPATVAQIISHMKPPLETPKPSVTTPGFYQLSIPLGIDQEADVTYYVQLPPQYDPYRRYPTIVTL
ncbi:MAG TPA: peptidase, partial [Pirellulales bacterium]|nr:peptidase [Pirellulales bacterium]